MKLTSGKQYCITCKKDAVVITEKGPFCKEHDDHTTKSRISNRNGNPIEIEGDGEITLGGDGGITFEG